MDIATKIQEVKQLLSCLSLKDQLEVTNQVFSEVFFQVEQQKKAKDRERKRLWREIEKYLAPQR
uniref:hypothetical protein n=1 Tax=Escherichia coli TaxID=562 RepID=UPI0013B36EA0